MTETTRAGNAYYDEVINALEAAGIRAGIIYFGSRELDRDFAGVLFIGRGYATEKGIERVYPGSNPEFCLKWRKPEQTRNDTGLVDMIKDKD